VFDALFWNHLVALLVQLLKASSECDPEYCSPDSTGSSVCYLQTGTCPFFVSEIFASASTNEEVDAVLVKML
jgi:hypothetical protein